VLAKKRRKARTHDAKNYEKNKKNVINIQDGKNTLKS